jgi:hypothetical protein
MPVAVFLVRDVLACIMLWGGAPFEQGCLEMSVGETDDPTVEGDLAEASSMNYEVSIVDFIIPFKFVQFFLSLLLT